MNTFKIGDEVSVEFMGTVTEIYLNGEQVYYVIDNGDTFARRVKAEQICLLPTEKDLGVKV